MNSKNTSKLTSKKTSKQTSNTSMDDKTKTLSKNLKKKHSIEKYCKTYKYDINGKLNKQLYNSCKINKYCRKYKCNDIDGKMMQTQIKKLGLDYNKLIMKSILNKCPVTISDKNRKRCDTKALKEFYNNNGMGEIYKKVIECDKNICKKEKDIFNTNLFRNKKTKLKIKQKKLLENANILDEPDKDLIESN